MQRTKRDPASGRKNRFTGTNEISFILNETRFPIVSHSSARYILDICKLHERKKEPHNAFPFSEKMSTIVGTRNEKNTAL